jgi:fido (protein-threonine AMPylation protein)
MTSDIFAGPAGSTPLPPEDQKGLRLSWITTREELNEAEQINILAGRAWAFRSRMDLTAETYLMRLHKRMLAMSGLGQANFEPARLTSAFCLMKFPPN